MIKTYHMPAEWQAQKAIWLAWPHEKDDWPEKFGTIPWVYCEMIRNIAASQQVNLIVPDQTKQDKAMRMLQSVRANLDNVSMYQIPTNRAWVRDSGPTFVKDQEGKEHLLNWRFNAWAKYDDWPLDNQVPPSISKMLDVDMIEPMYEGKHVVMEGGAIDVNGEGLLLATKECLLDTKVQTRNPGLSEQDYLAIFQQYLGVEEIIWLENGIAGDDTHGHVDDITRFVDTHRVITAVESNKADDNYDALKTNKTILEQYRTIKGKALEVIELPMPKALYFGGDRLPASYANFLICNNIVLVPTFNDPNDRVALGAISQCFPTREVIGIHAVDLVLGLGTIHCLSQQQPA